MNKQMQTIIDKLEEYKDSSEVALISGQVMLTYKELVNESKQIARALINEGLKKGDRVLFRMKSGPALIPAMIGILYAGGVVIAGDLRWPEQRNDFIKKDSGCTWEMTDEFYRQLTSLKPASEELKAVLKDMPEISSEDEAFIYYTSGSTGTPKGTILFHKALGLFSKPRYRVMLNITNIAYVLFLGNLYTAYFYGLCLVIPEESELQSADCLAQLIERWHVDCIKSTPTVFIRHLETPVFANAVKDLRYVGLTGEKVNENIIRRIRKSTNADIGVSYGTTEIFAGCLFVINTEEEEYQISLGKPFNGVKIYLLDEDGHPVKTGREGEIQIGGVTAESACYLNRPELTAEKYYIHPEYGRLFRTGDHGLLAEDGRILFIGRRDNMVKLHGQRIETGEIELVMEGFPGISSAAVRIYDIGGADVLCGYYVPEYEIDKNKLRDFLSRQLPYYMCPVFLESLEKMPENTNGKKNYIALPKPDVEGGEYVPPHNETEDLICRMFSKILKSEMTGANDNFFYLGGDSISGMYLISELKDRGIGLDMEMLFKYPTPEKLAEAVLNVQRQNPEAESFSESANSGQRQKLEAGRFLESTNSEARQELVAGAGAGEFPLSVQNIQRYEPDCQELPAYPLILSASERFMRRGHFYPVCSLYEINGNISEEHLKNRLEEIAENHEALHSVIETDEEGYPVQKITGEPKTAFFKTDLRALAKGEGLSDGQKKYLSSFVRMELSPGTELGRKIMFRLGLIRISDKKSILYIGTSHLILDGAGISAILQELISDDPVPFDRPLWEKRMRRLYLEDRSQALEYWNTFFDALPEPSSFQKAKSADNTLNNEQTKQETQAADNILGNEQAEQEKQAADNILGNEQAEQGKQADDNILGNEQTKQEIKAYGNILNMNQAKSDAHSAEAVRQKRSVYMAGGNKLYNDLQVWCAKKQTTMSIAMTLAVGRSLQKLMSEKSVMFYTMGTGRTAEEMKLPGMFTVNFPVYVREKDTIEDLKMQLINSDKHAWLFGVRDSGLPVYEDMLLINVQNVYEPSGSRTVQVTEFDSELMNPDRSIQGRYLEIFDTAIEVQLYPDSRFALFGWCDPEKYDDEALKKLMQGVIIELKSMLSENSR